MADMSAALVEYLKGVEVLDLQPDWPAVKVQLSPDELEAYRRLGNGYVTNGIRRAAHKIVMWEESYEEALPVDPIPVPDLPHVVGLSDALVSFAEGVTPEMDSPSVCSIIYPLTIRQLEKARQLGMGNVNLGIAIALEKIPA